MHVWKLLKQSIWLLVVVLAVVAVACGGDDGGSTGSGSEVDGGEDVLGSVSGPGPGGGAVADGDDVYTPVSDVDAHLNVALDLRDIAIVFGTDPVDYAAIAQIYGEGKNSLRGDGSARTLKGFATDPKRAEGFAAAAAFYGSATFLDDEITAAIEGTGAAASWSDGQRKQAINKGMLRILYYWVMTELNSAADKVAAGELDPAGGAPHNWDEAWAFYVGATADDAGARPYALAGTALKREGDYAKQGLIDAPLREALAHGLEEVLEGDLEDNHSIREIQSRMNAIFYIATARYFDKSYESAASGDAEATGVALIEGLSFYRTIQPMVAQADPDADAVIVAYYNRDAAATITEEERNSALAALNGSAVTSALALAITDLLSEASFS